MKANCATNGATSPNALAIVEQVPTAWPLRFVGYNSAEINQTNKNAAPEAHFPIKKKHVIAMLWDLGRKAKTTQQVPKIKIKLIKSPIEKS